MDKLIYFLSGVTAFTTLAIWLGKLIINKSFDLGLEKYKSSLQKEIEVHKNELARQSLEHEIKFSKLHADRAEKIKTLYTKVIELERALVYATTIAQGPEFIKDTKRDIDCMQTIQDLIAQLELDKIYFTKDTVAKFEEIIKEAWSIIFEMRKVRSTASSMDYYISAGMKPPESYLEHGDLWDKAFKRTQNEFRQLKESLADDFRKLIGL
jgi:hypothetical protein